MKSTREILATLQLSGVLNALPKKMIGGDVLVTCNLQDGNQLDMLFDKDGTIGQYFAAELERSETLSDKFNQLNICTDDDINLTHLTLSGNQ